MAQKKNNKKQQHTSDGNKIDNKSCKTCKSSTCAITASVIVICLAIAAYQIYVSVIKVPELPRIDLEEWWGPNTTRDNQDVSIRPYRVVFSDGMQEQLRKKFDLYRLHSKKIKSLKSSKSTYGLNSEVVAQVFAHWQFQYKYAERERLLNKFDHFKTNIQGLDIHFVHVKPEVDRNVKVLPLLLLHGWPGSIKEFYETIPLLTTVKEGYDFVFEIVAPSLPGFIYSQAPVRPGLSPFKIAVIMRNLMQRLGYDQFYVQGGDFGHAIGSHMATLFPKQVLGFHSNFPVNFSKLAEWVWVLGALWPTLVEDRYTDRMYPLTDKIHFYLEESGYMHLQATKPDSIGIALQDSPIGLAAYILEKYLMFTDPNNKFLTDDDLSKLPLSDLLDNVMLYWASGSITTAIRLYKESFRDIDTEQTMAKIPTSVPTWGLRLQHELVYQPEFMLRWKYTNLVGTTTLDEGGHYAAFEKPKELADDMFRAVESFFKFHER